MLATQSLTFLKTKASEGADLFSAVEDYEARKRRGISDGFDPSSDLVSQCDCVGGALCFGCENGADITTAVLIDGVDLHCNCDCVNYIYPDQVGVGKKISRRSSFLSGHSPDCNCDCTEIIAI